MCESKAPSQREGLLPRVPFHDHARGLTSAGRGRGQATRRQARLTSWLLQLMEDDNVMWVIEVFSEDGDFQAIEPICTENGLILQVCPEHLVLWGYRCRGWEA